MPIRVLTAADLRRALPMPRAIAAMRRAFTALDAGDMVMPMRMSMQSDAGTMLFMPAYDRTLQLTGQKVVGVFAGNADRGLPTIHAIVTLFDGESGEPLALLEGSTLTQIRTGAVSGLATDLLARSDAHVLTIFGAGGQAPAQIEAICAVRPIEHINVISRGPSAQRLAAALQSNDDQRRYVAATDVALAVQHADIIVAATASSTPLFDADWVRVGTHINGVGSFRPDMQELDARLISKATVIVDQRAAAQEEAGELIIAARQGFWSWDDLYAELGAVVSGRLSPPKPAETITLFKSCGLAIQDLAAAAAALDSATAEGLGQVIALD